MSSASIASKHSRRLSKEGITDGAHLHEQPPPENDTLRPADDDEENSGPSVVKLSSGISNFGPPQPPEPHVQESTYNNSPNGGLAAEAQKVVVLEDQPDPSELVNVMKQILDVLQDSTITSKSSKDNRSRFWTVYRRVAEEHDSEFLERYTNDMDIVLVFSGLFSAVNTSFIVAMGSNLSPDPNDTTHALLTQLVQIGLGNFTAAGSTPAAPASTWSPSTSNTRIQFIAYASLSMSLLAAFGAVLGKQWLGYYKSNRYGRGSQEEQGRHRQEKFDGIVSWYFDAVVQSSPILLQISLLLFGIALSANMWHQQYNIAWVIIATTVFGFLFYSLTVMAALVSPACPFQTPISTMLRMLRINRVICSVVKLASQYLTPVHGVLQKLLGALGSSWTRLFKALAGSVLAVGSFTRRCLQQLFGAINIPCFLPWLRSFVLRSPTNVVDSEAQTRDQNLDVVAKNQCLLNLKLSDTPTSSLSTSSIKWLLETSTDPEVFVAAASLVPLVEWPLDLDISDTLHHLYDIYTSCLDFQHHIVPPLEEKASASSMALCHLYCGRVLQAYPARGEFLGQGRTACHVFDQMLGRTKVNDSVLIATAMLSTTTVRYIWRFSSLKFGACPDSVLEWLSHFLPYHFIAGRVDEGIETLAIAVISKLLCSPSSPSTQAMANCALLACVMVGVQFDKKDIVRIDKSSALPQLAASLLAQFQQALWTCDGGDLGTDTTEVGRRAWNLLHVICRILGLARADVPSFQQAFGRKLDVCRKIFSRARSSEEDDPSGSMADLRHMLRFTLATACPSFDPYPLWIEIWWAGNSSPADFDWLVDFLDSIDSDDDETAGDILLLLCGVQGLGLAKQYLFIEKLIACMNGSMPPRLRHCALRAAHSLREVLASIQAIDDTRLQDMVLTKFSPAVLTAVCPRPGATPTDGSPDCFFDDNRDLCYLELVFSLARNSIWHPHLFGDGHIDRCISMVDKYCEPYHPHAFYLGGIFLRITSKKVSVTSLGSITQQEWWDMMRTVWYFAFSTIDDTHCFEFLPVLVEGTKKYVHIASRNDLEQFIGNVNDVLETLERRGLEQGEGVSVATKVKELRTVGNDMLQRFSQ